ncbi:hypothetical protein CDFC105_72102 [Clostridioides difficile]|nr:hypothetical protein CDFC105_60569 [Clostridioides difficile]CZS06324.1 hypothetical protein CDFC105_72102 [Clostridioides difficile]
MYSAYNANISYVYNEMLIVFIKKFIKILDTKVTIMIV